MTRRSHLLRVLLATCTVLTALVGTSAQALSMPPPWASAVWLGGPRFEAGAPVEVLHEEVVFDCRQEGDAVICDVDARMTVQSTASEPIAIQAAVTLPAQELRLAGHSVDELPDESSRERLNSILEANKSDANMPLHYGRFGARVFSLPFPDKTPRVLTYQGAVRLVRTDAYGMFVLPAVKARHLLLSDVQTDSSFDLYYSPSPATNRGPHHRVDVEVRHPRPIEIRTPKAPVHVPKHGQPPAGAWRSSNNGELLISRYDTTGGETISWSLFRPGRGYHLGGPFIGFGATDGGFRTRVGYELAAPEWLLFQVAAETDFHKFVTIVPAIEAASPLILLIPSFGIGLGAPIRIGPSSTEVGVRIQGSIAFGPLAFFTAADIYPGRDSNREDIVEWTFMGQVSF